MKIDSLHTRVLRSYIDAITAPKIVAIKRLLASSTGWMTSVLDRANAAITTTANNAKAAQDSADASANSATASANSSTDANNTWNALQAWAKNFNSHYLGDHPSDPTTDNEGNALIDEAVYYNTTTKHVRVYTLASNSWADQDEQTEVEMQNAQVSAANAAGSESRANAANDAAQAANSAAQAVLTSVNSSLYWMNTWWLGSSAGAPIEDLNHKALQPGNVYYDLNANCLKYWNGGNWFSIATSDDIAYLRNNYVNIDGSNSMTGPLWVRPSGNVGVVVEGNTSPSNNWSTSPGFTNNLTGKVQASSSVRTSYSADSDVTYYDFAHAGSKGTASFALWANNKFTTSGDIIAGNNDKGSANMYALGFQSSNADMAENYKSRLDLPKGTIVEISYSKDSDDELTEATTRKRVLGVISSDPGLVINSGVDEEEGYPVGLVGRVPTRVYGAVSKGDEIYLSIHPGVATGDSYLAEDSNPIGFALEDKESEGEDLVIVALKI